MAFCSNCGFQVSDDMLYCGKCGTKIIQLKKENICNECGYVVPDGMSFCCNCGAKVLEKKQAEPTIVFNANNGSNHTNENVSDNNESRNNYFNNNIYDSSNNSNANYNNTINSNTINSNTNHSNTNNSSTNNNNTINSFDSSNAINTSNNSLSNQSFNNLNNQNNYTNNNSNNTVNRSSSTYNNLIEEELYRKSLVGYYKGLGQISGTLIITNKKIMFNPLPVHVFSKPFTIMMNEVLNAERSSVMGINLCIKVTTSSGTSHTFALGLLNASDIQNVVDIINRMKQRS